ncbi:hypothetical protein J132_05117 [Termitomyces sp. J132]|nr:hypothetical protein J132_05117 [Termitomyces sp. J132]
MEASLTSVKYALYHAIGHWTCLVIGCYNTSVTSYLRTVTAGFVGGAIFTIPYLFLLGRSDSLNSDLDLSRGWLQHFGAEMLYSAIAGGVGAVAVGYGRVDGILEGMLDVGQKYVDPDVNRLIR